MILYATYAKIQLSFESDICGKSVVNIKANKEMVNMWIQFWANHDKENIIQFAKYQVKYKSVTDKGSKISLGVRMNGKKGNDCQVTVTKLGPTELKIDSKKSFTDYESIIGKLLKPMIWDIIDDLPAESYKINLEEGKQKCWNCNSESVEITRCTCCGQIIHPHKVSKRCSTPQNTCQGGCKKIEVRIFCRERNLLEIKLGKSEFYRMMMVKMKGKYTIITKAELIKKNEEKLKKICKSVKRKKDKDTDDQPVVTTKLRKLNELTNEKIGTLETRFRIPGDKDLEKFAGTSEPNTRSEKSKRVKADTVKDVMAATLELVKQEATLDDEMRDSLRLNLKLAACTDSPPEEGSCTKDVLEFPENESRPGEKILKEMNSSTSQHNHIVLKKT